MVIDLVSKTFIKEYLKTVRIRARMAKMTPSHLEAAEVAIARAVISCR